MLWPIPMIDRFSLIQHWDRWHMLCVYTHVQQVQRYFSCLFVHKSPRLYPAFRCFSKTKSLVPSSLIAHHWQEWPRLPQDYTEVVHVGNAEWGRMFLAPLGYDNAGGSMSSKGVGSNPGQGSPGGMYPASELPGGRMEWPSFRYGSSTECRFRVKLKLAEPRTATWHAPRQKHDAPETVACFRGPEFFSS